MPRSSRHSLTSLAVSALGELCGYAFGAGRAGPRCHEIEIHKARFVRQRPSWAEATWLERSSSCVILSSAAAPALPVT